MAITTVDELCGCPLSRLASWLSFGIEVPTRRLRAAVEALRATYRVEYPLAHLRPYLWTENRELTIGGAEVGLKEAQMIVRTGQLLISEGWPVVQRAQLGTDERGEKYMSELAADDEFPGIVVNPRRYSGQPTLAGRRVAVETIAGMVNAGEREEDLAANYGLSIAQVRAAVDYVAKHGHAA